jgi:hypothetical protein
MSTFASAPVSRSRELKFCRDVASLFGWGSESYVLSLLYRDSQCTENPVKSHASALFSFNI